MSDFRIRALAVAAILACGWLSSACGGSGGNGADSGPDASTDAGHESGKPRDSGKPDSAKKEGGPAEAGPDMTPIPGLPTEKWAWVPFPDAKCMDGSSTGIGVNLNPASDKLMIFMEGGNACFNVVTRSQTPASFGATDFNTVATTGSVTTAAGTINFGVGILDRTNPKNPVQDWSWVYVPYCTGDLHAGNNVTSLTAARGGVPQYSVGYANVGLYLDRLVPTFPKVTQVLLAGMSAGGFGVTLDYGQVAKAFSPVPVVMLDDSGPFFEDPPVATCLFNLFRTLWGYDKTVSVECGADCGNPGSFFLDYAKHVMTQYPKATFGLADSMDDSRISFLAGLGYNNCMAFQQVSAAAYGAGLLDIRSKLASLPNYGEFLFPGTQHTSTQDPSFYTQTAGGTADAGGADAGPKAFS